MDDPDAIWKPGYDGPPPILVSTREQAREPTRGPASEQSPGEANRADPAERTSRARWVGTGVALVLVLVAAAVVLDRPESSPVIAHPDPSVFGGPAARRLPAEAASLWSVDIRTDGDHWVEVIGRELVVVAVAEPVGTPLDATTPGSPVTTVIALDAPTGEQRWTLRLAAHPTDVTVIGAVDGVLVLEQPGVIGPTVIGVDAVTGETRWSVDAAPNDGHVGLVGTHFVARLPSSPDRFVSLIDAVSGRDVGAIVSDPMALGRPGGWSTDRRGTWHMIDDGEVVEYDLRTEPGDAKLIGSVDDASMPRLVVDARVATVDGSGSITFRGVGDRSPVTVSAEVPEPIGSLTLVSDSTFVVTAPRSIAGVSVEGDAANVTWSRTDGVVAADHPIEGGALLQVATRGGAGTQLVDGLTGATVEHLTMVPGALQALVVAGDGVVVLRTSDLGARLAGIDFDGTERWSIPGSTPIVVGDRIVVRATSDVVIDEDAASSSWQVRITVHGDAE